ncbi:hypothetical protein BO78DRAFT_382820 [Aspergillus sclerotiicarbonarius CBS 121057]|uniref:Uncharacterized protein n=1 Tax=Aspergillus sclerotiicarbonarius (strain CBS 121057 / IBT 28362) TaxID=1448318 RepID=A0A319F5B4_ASPSB|nr:hypothetical protein BO78DRAFT_382820 [Aspergillus sclerotiicarbonarius CBS 121057]
MTADTNSDDVPTCHGQDADLWQGPRNAYSTATTTCGSTPTCGSFQKTAPTSSIASQRAVRENRVHTWLSCRLVTMIWTSTGSDISSYNGCMVVCPAHATRFGRFNSTHARWTSAPPVPCLVRGHYLVSAFAVDEETGCAVSPDGRFLYIAVSVSNEVQVWAIGGDGMLLPTGHTVTIPRPNTIIVVDQAGA